MKMWIARDKSGALYLHAREPYKEGNCFFNRNDGYIKISARDFPEVTFENSPMEVELKLI